MDRIPLLDLGAQYRALRPEMEAAVESVFASGQFILGPQSELLEKSLSEYLGVKHAIGVASGTDALILSLIALGIGPGDEVITTALSFFATAEAIVDVGAKPVFCDIDPETFCLDVTLLDSLVTANTKAIIPVHLYGYPCDMDAISDWAKSHGLKIIEDCAQAIGAGDGKRKVGSWSDAAAFSFYPTKNLGAYGDAGAIVTQSDEVAARLRLLRVHGSRQRYTHEAVGMNSRLDEIQAACLNIKFPHLDDWNRKRREKAERYNQLIQEKLPAIKCPTVRSGVEHVFHLYCIRLKDRDEVQRKLNEEGISTQVAYPSTLYQQPALKGIIDEGIVCSSAESVCENVLALPLFPELSDAQMNAVVSALVKVTSY